MRKKTNKTRLTQRPSSFCKLFLSKAHLGFDLSQRQVDFTLFSERNHEEVPSDEKEDPNQNKTKNKPTKEQE